MSVYPKTAIGLFPNSFLNPKNEITNAILAANNSGYAYDPIGNRQTASNNTEALSYAVNNLNQYTNISGVNLSPLYDLDGNLTNYGAFAFVWDGENRLASVSSNGTLVASFKYDYMSRRYEKVVGSTTNTFIWDGWNCIAEINSATGNTNVFVWGLDSSGSIQGAGGIGGLLSVTKSDGTYFPVADGNGNISDYLAIDGSVAAHYEFDAYGKLAVATGDKAGDFNYLFSTKYFDWETSLYWFGYRYYHPDEGRWLSRDPLGEDGGVNLTAFCRNNPIDLVDPLGLWIEGGHYYTVLYVALAAGYSKEDALELAFFSQYPDYVAEYEAWGFFHPERGATDIVRQTALGPVGMGGMSEQSLLIEGVGHSLLGREAEPLRQAYSEKWKLLPSLGEKGMVLHFFGDLYGHSYVKGGKDWLYPNVRGHLSKLQTVDYIGLHYEQYEKYVWALYSMLKREGKCDDTKIERLLSLTKRFSMDARKRGDTKRFTYYSYDATKGLGYFTQQRYYPEKETASMKALAEEAIAAVGGTLPAFNPGDTVKHERVLKEGASFYGVPDLTGIRKYEPDNYVEFLRRVQSWIPKQ